MEGYVERMWVANSITDAVMLGEPRFLEMSMLRGGDGHCRLNRVFVELGSYAGRNRGGNLLMCLISRRWEADENRRTGAGLV
jgi:hypothetical protein